MTIVVTVALVATLAVSVSVALIAALAVSVSVALVATLAVSVSVTLVAALTIIISVALIAALAVISSALTVSVASRERTALSGLEALASFRTALVRKRTDILTKILCRCLCLNCLRLFSGAGAAEVSAAFAGSAGALFVVGLTCMPEPLFGLAGL